MSSSHYNAHAGTIKEENLVKITNRVSCSTARENCCYCFFIDGKLLYHCFDEKQALYFINEIVLDLQDKFKKSHPDHRVFIEKVNEWKYIIQRVRDGPIFSGKPRETHVVEIQQSSQLFKHESTSS